MALGLEPTTANSILNALCRGTSYAGNASIFVQLHVGDPGAAGTSNPATETTRKQATFGNVASAGSIANSATVTWPAIAGSQDATHFSAWTAASAGTFLFSGLITANAYTAGDDYVVAIGGFTATFALAA